MIEDKTQQVKDSIKRIVDLEKLRARRRALKQLLLGSGVITTGGLASAQTNRATSVLPSINLLLSDSGEQCGNASAPETPADTSITSPSEFVLNATNYTGTASQQTLVSSEDLESPVCVTVTYSVCLEVVSSDENLAKVNMDLIAIIEGLSNLDEANDDPAVDYYFRGSKPRGVGSNGGRNLNELPIERESVNSYNATGGLDAGANKSCGFITRNLPFTLSIKNNSPIIDFGELRRDIAELSYAFSPFRIALTAGDCMHPERFEQTCIYTRSPGPNTLTTPEAIDGPPL